MGACVLPLTMLVGGKPDYAVAQRFGQRVPAGSEAGDETYRDAPNGAGRHHKHAPGTIRVKFDRIGIARQRCAR